MEKNRKKSDGEEIKSSSRRCHLVGRRQGGEEGGEGEKKRVVTTCKLKNLHSCLVLTSRGRAACGAVALSWPARSTWPAPPAIGRATANRTNSGRRTLAFCFQPRTRRIFHFQTKRCNAGGERPPPHVERSSSFFTSSVLPTTW